MRWQEIAEQQLRIIRRQWVDLPINNRVWHYLNTSEYEIKVFPYNLGEVGYYGKLENSIGKWKLVVYSMLRDELLFDQEMYCDTVEPVLIAAATVVAQDIEREIEKTLLG